MPEYTLYVDAWLLRLGANFAFEYLLLWATAAVTRTPTTAGRLVAGSLIGTLHYMLYLLASLRLIPFYGFLRFLPVIIVVSLLMIVVVFRPIRRQRILSILAYFYVIGFVAAGAGIGGAYLFGGVNVPNYTLGMFIAVAAILVIAELGWGVVHQRFIHNVYHLPIKIVCGDKSSTVQALVDTGNNLKDPLSRQPVMIVEHQAVKDLIPAEIADAIRALEQGDLLPIGDVLESSEWSTRFRVIPFSSIGKENGLLVGFRPDQVHITNNKGELVIQPVIAIHPHQLDPEGKYEALIPPTILQQAIDQLEPTTIARGGQPHATSPHSKI